MKAGEAGRGPIWVSSQENLQEVGSNDSTATSASSTATPDLSQGGGRDVGGSGIRMRIPVLDRRGRRIDRPMTADRRHTQEILEPTGRVHYALGVLSIDEDFEGLEVNDE